MSVYVDDMRAPFGRLIMCHMVADDEAELHEMADRIGIARKWFQGDHYDVCLSKRAAAVRFGAKEIESREIVSIIDNMIFVDSARCRAARGGFRCALPIGHSGRHERVRFEEAT